MAEETDTGRVSKRPFIAAIAARVDLPVKTTSKVYEAMLVELLEVVARGDRLVLTGFGGFHKQVHKGHKVQFADADGGAEIGDYSVLKFSATRETNRKLDEPAKLIDP